LEGEEARELTHVVVVSSSRKGRERTSYDVSLSWEGKEALELAHVVSSSKEGRE